MESIGMEYDSDVLAIYVTMEEQPIVQPRIDINLDLELELRNTNKYLYVDVSDTVSDELWSDGHVNLETSITRRITVSTESTDARYALELLFGFSFSQDVTVKVIHDEYHGTPIRTVVNPRYEVQTGEIWEDDVWQDDYWGAYEVKKLVGHCIWRLKPGDETVCSE